MNRRKLLLELEGIRRSCRGVEMACEHLIDTLGAPDNDTAEAIDQHASVLGPRKHCAAVRRRLEEYERGGLPEPGASIVGKRHLLTADALTEEIARASGPALARAKARRGRVAGGVPSEAARKRAAFDSVVGRYRGRP